MCHTNQAIRLLLSAVVLFSSGAADLFAANYGLTVGIGNYASGRGLSSVSSCRAGATTFRNYLLKDSARWHEGDIALLVDSQATKSAILAEIAALAAIAGTGDTVVYYHSGHGGQVSGTDTLLCAYDTNMLDSELAAALEAFGSGVKVIIVIDACHSAGMFINATTAVSSGREPWLFAQNVMAKLGSSDMRTTAANAEIAWITSCDYDEVAMGIEPGYGFFTMNMFDAFTFGDDNDGILNFLELFEYAEPRANRDNPHQLAQSLNDELLRDTVAAAAVSSPEMQEALDNTELQFATGGHSAWFSQTARYHADNDAACSGDIGDNEISWISTVVEGPGEMTFWWRTMCEDPDGITVFVDAQWYDGLWALQGDSGGWKKYAVPVPAGEHVIRWIYAKDDGGSASLDCGFLDTVAYSTNIAAPELEEAVDTTQLDLITGTTPSWYRQTSLSYSGGDAAASGSILNVLGCSWMASALTGPCRLSFRARVSSAANCLFWFVIDQQPVALVENTGSWMQYEFEIAPGMHDLLWLSIRVDSGSCIGYVDDLSLTPSDGVVDGSINEAVDAPWLSFQNGGEAGWVPQTMVTSDGEDAIRSGVIGDGQTSWLQTTLNGGPGLLSFWWKVSSEDGCDFIRFYVDDEEMARMTGDDITTDWNQRSFLLGTGSHHAAWVYVKDDATEDDEPSADIAWIDRVSWTGDSDGDGMPDPWEEDHGLCPTNSSGDDGRTGDWDEDGADNYSEYIAGTHPTNGMSLLCFTSLNATGDTVCLEWQGGTNARQFIQYTDNLIAVAPTWNTLSTNNPPTAVATSLFYHCPGAMTRIYRIKAERP